MLDSLNSLQELHDSGGQKQFGDQPVGVELPFRLTATHVEFGEREKPQDDWRWSQICGRLEVVANSRSKDGENWGCLVRFRDRDGRTKDLAIPMRAFAGDSQEVRSMLLDRGLTIEPTAKARSALSRYLQSCKPTRFVQAVERIGWHPSDGGHVFVLPDNASAAGTVALQTDGDPKEHAFGVSGTLLEWNQHVATYAAGNSRLALSISLAFAAPLLDVIKLESGGIHLVGASTTGKSTCLAAAGSAWGGGPDGGGYVRTWRATSNGLEAVAAQHCDALLCLDEMGQVDGKDAGEIAYMLANEQGKNRAGRAGHARRAAKWRLLFLSSGELSLADKMAEDPRRRIRAGQEVRITNVSADAGKGFGVFENLHGLKSAKALADTIKVNAGRYYGSPARALIARVSFEDRAALASTIRSAMEVFVNDLDIGNADAQVQRGATRFALAAAAGELCIAWEILNWPQGTAIEGAKKCFFSWLQLRGGKHSGEFMLLLRQVREFIERHGESRFTSINEWGTKDDDDRRLTVNRVGFRYDDDEGTHYLVLPAMMKSEVCLSFDLKWAANKLLERKLLLAGEDGKTSRNERVPGIGKKGTTRLYHLLPAIMVDGVPDDE